MSRHRRSLPRLPFHRAAPEQPRHRSRATEPLARAKPRHALLVDQRPSLLCSPQSPPRRRAHVHLAEATTSRTAPESLTGASVSWSRTPPRQPEPLRVDLLVSHVELRPAPHRAEPSPTAPSPVVVNSAPSPSWRACGQPHPRWSRAPTSTPGHLASTSSHPLLCRDASSSSSAPTSPELSSLPLEGDASILSDHGEHLLQVAALQLAVDTDELTNLPQTRDAAAVHYGPS